MAGRALLCFLLVSSAFSLRGRDVIIPPLIDPPATLLENLTSAPPVDRSAAVELARIRLRPAPVRQEEEGLLSDGEVQALIAPLRLGAQSRIAVEGASASRLRFTGVPAGTVLWLTGSDDEEPIRYEPAAADTWGPTTHGATVYIAVEGPAGAAAIAAIAGVRVSTDAGACLEDVACVAVAEAFEGVMEASRAVAYVRFVRDGRSYICSGALVSDAAGTRTPYLLTARHCIDDAETAASVEIIWDLRSSACGSNRMARYTRTYGAELLVASERTDVALLKLASLPPGRVFLGIDTRGLPAGTPVHRVSHAAGLSQTFAAGVVEEAGSSCAKAPRPAFVYSRPTAGGIATGSSGAPLLVHGLYVAGQLLGLCGADPKNPCARFNDAVDGSIRESWPLLAPYLDPSPARTRRRAMR